MENLTLVSPSPKSILGYGFSGFSLKNSVREFTNCRNPTLSRGFPFSLRKSKITSRSSRIYASAHSQSRPAGSRENVLVKYGGNPFASVSSSSAEQTSSVGYPNVPLPPSSSSFGSPLFWIGIGVGLSALFSWVTSYLKKYAMQQAMKTMMSQMNMQNNQFNSPAFPTGSPFPFQTPSQTGPGSSPFQAASQRSATVDVTATKVEAPPAPKVEAPPAPKAETPLATEAEALPATEAEAQAARTTGVEEKAGTEKKEKNYAFVDVSPEETVRESPFRNFEDIPETSASRNTEIFNDVLQNGAASKLGSDASGSSQSFGTGKQGPGLSVEALEKMMEDPTVQKMVYPYLPEEMRNPETFKWMLQNPQYRQQLEDMLNNMSGSGEWDQRMTDTLKNFDLNSPEVRQQFDQIGLTPEEVMTKIMANPEVALAFQNPRVQAALMDCSQNPMNIMKYQNDKEVMDVFNKISQLFPGMQG